MRVMIIDDEPLSRRGVRARLRKMPDVQIVGECGDGTSGVEGILKLEPDLIFLDVQMPGMDGFGVLRALPTEHLLSVIFLTAQEEHALRAFEVSALDLEVGESPFRSFVTKSNKWIDSRRVTGGQKASSEAHQNDYHHDGGKRPRIRS